jgi:hypothetical protein
MKCTICKHPDREKIDEAIIGGKSIRSIVENFGGTSRETVRRHTKHVLAIVRKHDEIQQLAHAGSLKAKLIMREADLLRIQQQAEINKDLPTAISAIRELRQCHELQAKVEGHLKPQEVAVVAVNLDEETSRRVARTYLQRHPKEQHQDDEP